MISKSNCCYLLQCASWEYNCDYFNCRQNCERFSAEPNSWPPVPQSCSIPLHQLSWGIIPHETLINKQLAYSCTVVRRITERVLRDEPKTQLLIWVVSLLQQNISRLWSIEFTDQFQNWYQEWKQKLSRLDSNPRSRLSMPSLPTTIPLFHDHQSCVTQE